jgi:signal transduction histidine kinase
MMTLRARLMLLVASAAVAPLIAYGLVSMWLLRSGTEQSAISEAQVVAGRAAEQIERYVRHNLDLLDALGADLQHTGLQAWQQERILRNYVLAFPAFDELTLFNADGTAIVSSRLTEPDITLGSVPEHGGAPLVAPIEVDDDLLPKTVVTSRVDGAGTPPVFLAGALRLEELWRLVDRIRVGERGFALLIDRSGRLIAHGDPDAKSRVARGESLLAHPLMRGAGENADGTAPARWARYTQGEEELLGVARHIPLLGWDVVLEQPTSQAFALAERLERYLAGTIALALLATVAIASLWGRSFLRRIGELMRGTRALAEGRLQERVAVTGRDELASLGAAFNRMADRVVDLQAEAVKQERQATFGRIAAGLVHDIAHPIQNIGNNCKLILKMHDDEEYRETFRRMVDRELSAIRRLLDDLRNLGRPIPLEPFPIDVNRSLSDAAERMRLMAEQAGITLEVALSDEALFVEADVFALGRVYRNLVLNAVQATAPGGVVRLSSRAVNDRVLVEVRDTGCGIAPDRLAHVFDDYLTTKRRGLGLGLAISRKIVEQLGGAIGVESRVGQGTTFTLDFPVLRMQAVERGSVKASA